MKKQKTWAWVVLFATFNAIVCNTLAESLKIFGTSMLYVSDKWHTHLTPAGPAFSVWSLIYLATIGFSIWQLLPAQIEDVHLQKMRPWMVGSALFNAAFPFAFHAEEMPLATVCVLGLLATLIPAYLIAQGRIAHNWTERTMVQIALSIYLGWVCVATAVSIAISVSALEILPLEGAHVTLWAWIGLSLLVGVGTFMTWHFYDPILAFTVAWALYWISVEQPVPVEEGALLACAMMVAIGAFQFLRNKPTPMPSGNLI